MQTRAMHPLRSLHAAAIVRGPAAVTGQDVTRATQLIGPRGQVRLWQAR